MYILIDPQVLEDKGLHYYEKMPDGRAIAETNLLKVLGSVKSVEFVSTTAELNEMRKVQQEELTKQQDLQKAEEIAPSSPVSPEREEESSQAKEEVLAPDVELLKIDQV